MTCTSRDAKPEAHLACLHEFLVHTSESPSHLQSLIRQRRTKAFGEDEPDESDESDELEEDELENQMGGSRNEPSPWPGSFESKVRLCKCEVVSL